MAKIICPKCKAEALPGGMLRDKKIAKCHKCLGWFDYEKIEQLTFKLKEIPERIEIIEGEDHKKVIWKNTNFKGLFGILVGIPLGIYTTTLLFDAITVQRWGFGAMNLFFAMVGGLITYGGLINVLNRIEVIITSKQFKLIHKPIPLFDNRDIPLEKIEGITVQKNIGLKKKKPFIFYDLFLKTTWNETPIITGIKIRSEALSIREVINVTIKTYQTYQK